MQLRIDLQQDSQEWLDFRKKMIGASDAPVIMDASPWKTPLQLLQEKLGLVPDQKANSAMLRGKELEEKCRYYYQIDTGYIVPSQVLLHKTIPYMMASIDGLTEDGNHAIEIKCPNKKDHEIAKKNLIPEKYYPQLQHQLEVLGLNFMYYVSYHPGDSEQIVCSVKVKRDEMYIEALLKKESEFYQQMKYKIGETRFPRHGDSYM